MRVHSSLAFAFVAGTAILAACSEAGGDVKGGEPTPTADASTTPSPVKSPCDRYEDVGSGTKWSDLYRDMFGPTSRAGSCSFETRCHGSPEGSGAKSPSGVKCFDEKGCRQSFIDQGLVEASQPESSALIGGLLRLCRPDGSQIGIMPQAPTDFVFPAQSVDRIRAWIRDGAKDD